MGTERKKRKKERKKEVICIWKWKESKKNFKKKEL